MQWNSRFVFDVHWEFLELFSGEGAAHKVWYLGAMITCVLTQSAKLRSGRGGGSVLADLILRYLKAMMLTAQLAFCENLSILASFCTCLQCLENESIRLAAYGCLMAAPYALVLMGPDCSGLPARGTSMRNALNWSGVGHSFVTNGNVMCARLPA